MVTKVEAARIATGFGIPVRADRRAARRPRPWPASRSARSSTGSAQRPAARLFWLAHATTPRGRLHLDPGAVARGGGPAQVAAAGRHHRGGRARSPPATRSTWSTPAGAPVARGLVNYDAVELPGLLGRSTGELAAALGPGVRTEVVHRDDLVLL